MQSSHGSDEEENLTPMADIDQSYKNDEYWKLPENVRNAIDVAKMKAKHSQFYYRLQTLNDKIFVFRNIYYTKIPYYHRYFLERKKKELEERLLKQKQEFIQEMAIIEKRIAKRMNKTSNDVSKFAFGIGNRSPNASPTADKVRRNTTGTLVR